MRFLFWFVMSGVILVPYAMDQRGTVDQMPPQTRELLDPQPPACLQQCSWQQWGNSDCLNDEGVQVPEELCVPRRR